MLGLHPQRRLRWGQGFKIQVWISSPKVWEQFDWGFWTDATRVLDFWRIPIIF